MSAPWPAAFQSLKDDGSIEVRVTLKSGFMEVDGAYEGVASWWDRSETQSFDGITVVDHHGVMTWIPYEQIRGVTLL